MSLPNTYLALLLEDEKPAREHLAAAINMHPQLALVDAVATCQEALDSLGKHQPDILISDLGLPDGHGVKVIREAKRLYPNIEVLVVTTYADEEHVVEALEAGASGYLLKRQAFETLGEAIITLMRGESAISPEVARFLLKRFNQPEKQAEPKTESPLTAREHEVLKWIAKGYSYDEIAAILDVSANTIRTHIRSVYKKLSVNSRSEAVFEATNLGIISLND
ncbi:MAG TPA: response regulator transcription factor [Ghiorsea sp.]|nr:response regulator transcription factor [Ghiorsea sp.]HIP06826.1 response regulator transcription factor [Mariprofundaceae bacterium]